ncbi:hypothetical protein CLAVI_000533 [Candidatus Clavichlamydia salmonicola]|uniref:hypothetical protein n=1 Tax=Candidatus Clavichlamydia salmonicola TaxID=469812 RepID=UPI0018912EAA|nr:hypothetical protein [Candidatus Clavichlamydia salmonicola]MBF5050911.1 hypothetical protein [Candidatus Clavichlamydia salmonicola]
MSFISNIFGFAPPKSLSQAARNYRRNVNRLYSFPGLQTAVSTVMGVSMAILTAEVFAGDPLVNPQTSSSHTPSPIVLGMKIAALTIMGIANSAILGDALTSVLGERSIRTLSPTTPNRNYQLYILTGFNLAGSSFGLVSVISFIFNSTLQHQHPNPLQVAAITSGTLSSVAYTVEAVVASIMCSRRTVSERRTDGTIIIYQPLDDSDDDDSEIGSSTPLSPVTIVEID